MTDILGASGGIPWKDQSWDSDLGSGATVTPDKRPYLVGVRGRSMHKDPNPHAPIYILIARALPIQTPRPHRYFHTPIPFSFGVKQRAQNWVVMEMRDLIALCGEQKMQK